MDRTIASVAVRPVFIVHFKFNFWKDVTLSGQWMQHGHYYFVQFCWWKHWKVTYSVAALRRKRKSYSTT